MVDEAEHANGAPTGDDRSRVVFDYIKGQFFRVIRADGAIGGVTPNGHIHLAFFSERAAIPRRLVHELSPSGELGEVIPTETVSRNSIVREMDVDVFLPVPVAETLHRWLGEKIKEAKAAIAGREQGEQRGNRQ